MMARAGAALLNLILVVLVGGFAAAAFVRCSPGFDVDDSTWDARISSDTRKEIQARNRVDVPLPVFYGRYLLAAARGDFGVSKSFQVPVSELLRARAAVSLKLILWGTTGGILLGAFLAWVAVWPRKAALAATAWTLTGLLIAIPPAVLALFFFFREAPLGAAVALAVSPRIFGTMHAVLEDLYRSSGLFAARARGLQPFPLAVRYVLAPALPHLLGLLSVALVVAFGCLIPIETLCDVPGIGQLAWKAASARDLPLLCGLALIVTFAVSAVHSAGELTR